MSTTLLLVPPDLKTLRHICFYFRVVGAGDAMVPLDVVRSVNPISTRKADYVHHITTGLPGFQTFLRPCLSEAKYFMVRHDTRKLLIKLTAITVKELHQKTLGLQNQFLGLGVLQFLSFWFFCPYSMTEKRILETKIS